MVKEKDYFVLVSERPSLNGSPDDIVEQTLKISDTGLAWFATRTARQKETGRGYHEKYVSRIGEWRAEILLRMTDRVKQRAEFPAIGNHRETRLSLASRTEFLFFGKRIEALT